MSRVREEKDRNNSHITLLAKNKKGLSNLWAWTTEAYNDNFYYRALQDWDGARKYADGLFASDGCLLSYMADSIIKDDEGRQHELMAQYLDVFGENFYMELHTFQFIEPQTSRDVELNQQMTKVNQAKVELANNMVCRWLWLMTPITLSVKIGLNTPYCGSSIPKTIRTF